MIFNKDHMRKTLSKILHEGIRKSQRPLSIRVTISFSAGDSRKRRQVGIEHREFRLISVRIPG